MLYDKECKNISMECLHWKVGHSHWIVGDQKGVKKNRESTQGNIKKDFYNRKQINLEEVHPKLRNYNHTMEGTVIGTFIYDPFDLLQVIRTMFYI